MAQRFSGRERQNAEWYPTPPWATRVLLDHFPDGPGLLGLAERRIIWEPACGAGDMVTTMRAAGRLTMASDRTPQACFDEAPAVDFLDLAISEHVDGYRDIATNPPYGIQGRAAEEFIKVALRLTKHRRGRVAMLLKMDFDSGRSRSPFFRDCPAWAKKVVLLQRLLWFPPVPDPKTGKKHGPSENHAWFIWDWSHSGAPSIVYDDGLRHGSKEWKGKEA